MELTAGYSLKDNELLCIGGRVLSGRESNVYLTLDNGGTIVRAYIPIEGLLLEAPIGEVELLERRNPYADWHRVAVRAMRASIEYAERQYYAD